MKLHSNTYGTDGPALIILHGLLGSSDNWHTVAKALSVDRRVYALDARNHGRSPHDPLFTYQAMAEDVREFMRERGIKSAAVMGHSMGGKTAMMLALDSHASLLPNTQSPIPSPVSSLIVVDIAPKPMRPGHDEILAAMRSIDFSRVKFRKDIDEAIKGNIPNVTTRQFILKNLKVTEDGAFEWKLNLDAVFKSYDEVNRDIDSSKPFMGPTLFIRGAKSRYILDEDVEKIQELFPHSKLMTIPEASHWVHADAPEAFLACVKQFLEEI
jgi:pimeloyl-ACP methyl ester carboxylesterase